MLRVCDSGMKKTPETQNLWLPDDRPRADGAHNLIAGGAVVGLRAVSAARNLARDVGARLAHKSIYFHGK